MDTNKNNENVEKTLKNALSVVGAAAVLKAVPILAVGAAGVALGAFISNPKKVEKLKKDFANSPEKVAKVKKEVNEFVENFKEKYANDDCCESKKCDGCDGCEGDGTCNNYDICGGCDGDCENLDIDDIFDNEEDSSDEQEPVTTAVEKETE